MDEINLDAPLLLKELESEFKKFLTDEEWEEFSLLYLDDVLTHSRSAESAFCHMAVVVFMHWRDGLKLNLAKTHLFHTKLKYMGFQISADGIQPDPDYLERIISWPLPETGKQLASFLGVFLSQKTCAILQCVDSQT